MFQHILVTGASPRRAEVFKVLSSRSCFPSSCVCSWRAYAAYSIIHTPWMVGTVDFCVLDRRKSISKGFAMLKAVVCCVPGSCNIDGTLHIRGGKRGEGRCAAREDPFCLYTMYTIVPSHSVYLQEGLVLRTWMQIEPNANFYQLLLRGPNVPLLSASA